MSGRSFLSDLLYLLLFVVAGAMTGLAFGLLRASQFVAGLDLRTDALVRVNDAIAVQFASSLLSGNASVILSILVLVLGLVLLAVALLLTVRRAEQRGRALITMLIGLAIGGGLAAMTLIFAGNIGRAETAMTSAGLGGSVLARYLVWPRIVYPLLFGATIGWAAGAVRASGTGRRILLFVPTLIITAGAIVVLVVIRPPLIEVPANVPALTTGDEGGEMTVYLIGGTKEALPVTLDLKVFVERDKGNPLKIDRRNVSRALKVSASLPKLHPMSAAAENLLVAGAMAELDVEKAARRLLKTFERRGHYTDGEMAAVLIGRLAPTEEAIKLLKQASDLERYEVGPVAASHLCKLAKISGTNDVVKRLQCSGKASKVKVGQIKGKLHLQGRPLRRAPIGLIAEPAGLKAPWVKKGRVSAAALDLVAGGRTSAQGDMTFNSIPPGKYLLVVAPRRMQAEAEPVILSKVVTVEMPSAGGVVALGNIEAGGKAPQGRRPHPIASRGIGRGAPIDGVPSTPSIVHPNAGGDTEDGPSKVASKQAPERPRPLPRAAKRLIAKIRPVKEGHVEVPDGFGTTCLDADSGVLASTASVVPVNDKGGRPMGLKIKGIRSNGVAVALGFVEGDIIQAVNGRPTRSPDDLIKLVDLLDKAKIVRVRIKRDDRPKTLRIDVDR